MSVTIEPQQVSALTSLSANIPALAIQAASELDDMIEKRTEASITSRKLGEALLAAIRGQKHGNQPVSIKSGTVAVFCNALEQLPHQQPINTMADLVSLATRISQDLSVSKSESELVRLKQFCIALAKASSTYRPTVDNHELHLSRR